MPDFGDIAERAAELAIRMALALAVIAAFVGAERLMRPLVQRLLDRRGRPSYTRVFTGLFRVATVLVGSLFALTLTFPSVRVADVLAIFGIISVAAGFAFKDSFENLLAGVLLLLRDPFKSGDQLTSRAPSPAAQPWGSPGRLHAEGLPRLAADDYRPACHAARPPRQPLVDARRR